MRLLAPLGRTFAVFSLLWSAPTGAVTLEQYFYGFSDRDRGVYLTGVLDFFAADSSRDPEYRQCVKELGPTGMHAAISQIVREDPRLLSFDASLWLLYEASRQCNTSGADGVVPDPRSMLPPRAEEAGVPDLATDAAAEDADDSPAPGGLWPLRDDWPYAAGGLALLLFGGLLGSIFTSRRMRRGRRASPARPPAHSSERG